MAPDVEEIRAALAAERARTRERIAALTGNVTAIVEGARFTATDDEHDPEGSTIAFERSQAGALLTASHDQLAEIEAAIGRLDDDTYGHCETCGRPIAHERLTARPTARACIDCAAGAPRR